LAIGALSVVIGARSIRFGPRDVASGAGRSRTLSELRAVLFTLYRLLDLLSPNSFSGLPATGSEFGSGAALLYFSFSTLTTVGYGDNCSVAPDGAHARQFRSGHWPAISGNAAGAAGQPRNRASTASPE